MSKLKIINDIAYAPFYLFIKGVNQISDNEIFDLFRIGNPILVNENPDEMKTSIFLANDSEWTHVIDDWDYNLYHTDLENGCVEKLSQQFELFTGSVGEDDRSYEFRYYKDGKLVRHFEQVDVDYKRLWIKKNDGVSLKGEENFESIKDELERIYEVVKGLGIRLKHTADDIRHYEYLLNFD